MHPVCRALATLLTFLALPCALAHAQATVPAVMLSDIHFDPFHDPAKLTQLRAEPIEHWPAILNAPPSATQAADLQALQTNCGSRALDTSWPLLQNTLGAARGAQPRPLFVTLSGDLLTHEFPCRFNRLVPGPSAQELSAFTAKTIAFVLAQLRATFPRTPVYSALGNNDSPCGDYRATPADSFLKSAANTLATAAGTSPESITPEGDYSVHLPAPLQHTRLIVFEDIFESRGFTTCSGDTDRAPERAQIDWLRSQLADARALHGSVWVMSHIPPGVDAYTSFRRYLLQPAAMCNADPRPFLADTALPDTLLDYADVVRLAVFGHTHMDEMRLLRRDASSANSPSAGVSASAEGTSPAAVPEATIPAKLVPSVSPYIGNHPAFLVASIDPRSAILKDWRTFVSPGPEGSTPPWTVAYRFTSTFHLPDFSAGSALKLADELAADKTGQAPDSTAFRQHFYPGDIGLYALGLAQIWPAYACTVRHVRPSAVHTCLCN